MIKILITIKNKQITTITVKGHTHEENDITIEPLCATVSAVVLGGVKMLKKLKKNDIKYQVNDGYLKIIVLKEDQKINTILETIVVQLENIKNFFKKNIEIKKISS